jgi:hypothetical protein
LFDSNLHLHFTYHPNKYLNFITMPPKAAAPKAKATAPDHASYQGEH